MGEISVEFKDLLEKSDGEGHYPGYYLSWKQKNENELYMETEEGAVIWELKSFS